MSAELIARFVDQRAGCADSDLQRLADSIADDKGLRRGLRNQLVMDALLHFSLVNNSEDQAAAHQKYLNSLQAIIDEPLVRADRQEKSPPHRRPSIPTPISPSTSKLKALLSHMPWPEITATMFMMKGLSFPCPPIQLAPTAAPHRYNRPARRPQQLTCPTVKRTLGRLPTRPYNRFRTHKQLAGCFGFRFSPA